MAFYRPSVPFSTVLIVLKPTYSTVAGVRKKTLPDLEQGFKIHSSFKTYGGTEKTVDGLIAIDDTADPHPRALSVEVTIESPTLKLLSLKQYLQKAGGGFWLRPAGCHTLK